MQAINNILHTLTQSHNRKFYLSFLRVFCSLWMLKEIVINIPYLHTMYAADSFVEPRGWLLLHQHYILFIICYSILLLVNTFGIGKNFTAVIVFLFTEMLFRLNPTVVNGGFHLCRFMLLYLSFANTYTYFTLKPIQKNISDNSTSILLTNIAVYAILIHLCIIYFSTALYKLQTPQWRNGTAIYYILHYERYNGTGHNAALAKYTWLNYTINYFTLAFELVFPFLIWFKPCRKWLIIAGIIMHLTIYWLFMLYGFQFVFIAVYGLFYTDEEWKIAAKKLIFLLPKKLKK